MNQIRAITALICFLASVLQPAGAQQPYLEEQSFPSAVSAVKHVTGIGKDKNNCIWFGTQTGIYRYDGSRFRHFSVLNTPALKFERIGQLYNIMREDGAGWCFLDSKGNIYDVDSLSRIRPFVAIKGDQVIYGKFSTGSFFAKENANDSLASITLETHMLPQLQKRYVILRNGDIRVIPTADFANDGIGNWVYSLGNRPQNKTFSTGKDLYIIGKQSLLRAGSAVEPVSLQGDIITMNKTIVFDSLRTIVTTDPSIHIFIYKGCIYDVKETGQNILTTRLLARGDKHSFPSFLLYVPREQVMVASYLDRGVVIYRPRRFSLLSWHPSNLDGSFNDDDYYYSIIPEKDGFITSNDEGIIRLKLDGTKQLLTPDNSSRFFLWKDKAGNIWHQGSLQISYYNIYTGKSAMITSCEPNNVLTGIYQVDDETFYLLTNQYLAAVTRRNGVTVSKKILLRHPPKTDFTVLYTVDNQTMWIGSDQGMIEYDIPTGTAKPLDQLGKVYVRSILKIGEGNYLVGTYDKGIFQYDDKQWKPLEFADKKIPSSAHGFLMDKRNKLIWVSSNQGIYTIPLDPIVYPSKQSGPLRSGHFKDFGPLIPAEFNGSSNISAAQLSDTCFVFANARGLVVFDPSALVSPPLPVRILAEPSEEDELDSGLRNRQSPYQFVFNPVVPYYSDRGELEIEYRLSNSDKDWHTLSGNSIISYNNLRSGDHELQFRIRNYNDMEGKELVLRSAHFTVPERWYEKTWFLVTAGLVILFLIIFLHNLRIWYIKKSKKRLERLVKLKTAELQESNENLVNVIDELRVSETNLRQSNYLKDEYYAVLTHDLRSPLKFLSFNISQLLELLPELTNEALKKGLVAAYECSNDVYKLIDEFVYWIQDNEKQLQVRPSAVLVDAVVMDAKKIYGISVEGNKNSLVTDMPAGLSFQTDPKLIFIVLRNAIDNANKYTSGGTISISATRQNGNLQLTISDTGRGMKEEMIRELTDLQQNYAWEGYKQRKSLGFYIMAMLTKKLGGSYSIASVKDKGTTLSFTFPELKTERPGETDFEKDETK